MNGRGHDEGGCRNAAKGQIDKNAYFMIPGRFGAIIINDAFKDGVDDVAAARDV